MIAGGEASLLDINAEAEDDTEAALAGITALKLTPQDTVIALSASGTTPFTLTAARAGDYSTILGTFNSAADQSFTLDFYANSELDPSGYGEGERWIGSQIITTDGSGNASFLVTLDDCDTGEYITATATDSDGNTSEFSACATVSIAPRLSITNVSSSQLSLAWTNTTPGFALKQTTNLSAPVIWSPVTNAPVLVGGRYVVTLSHQPGNRFYVLQLE